MKINKIGKGGFGDVFLYLLDGVDDESHRFAVKFIDFNKAKTDELRRASLMKGILAENFILTKLKHENIVNGYFYHLVELRNTEYFFCHFMEFCNGETLEKLLQEKKEKNKFLKEEEILKMFTDILKGIQYAQFFFRIKKPIFFHKKLKQKGEGHIMHRDLKPDNFFFHTTKDGRRILKIGDFGLAKVYLQETNPIVIFFFWKIIKLSIIRSQQIQIKMINLLR